jgi:hypothetical protein
MEDDDDPEWTRLERVVLPLIRHGQRPGTALAGLVASCLLCATFMALAASQVVDDLILSDRGILTRARVVRVNEGRGGDTVNVVLSRDQGGSDVLIEKLATTPQVGDTLQVLLDPENPGRAIDARVSIWRWTDFGTALAGAVAGAVSVAELRHWRRLRDRHRGHRQGRHRR